MAAQLFLTPEIISGTARTLNFKRSLVTCDCENRSSVRLKSSDREVYQRWPASISGLLARRSVKAGTIRLDELIRRGLAARNNPRDVIGDPKARYYGVTVTDNALASEHGARLGEIRFENWLSQSVSQIPAANRQPAAGQEWREAYDDFKNSVAAGTILNRHPDGAGR